MRKEFRDILEETPRPKTRADCECGERPCPWVGCAYNLFLTVNEKNGIIKYTNPKITDPLNVPPNRSCILDIADESALDQETVGKILNITRSRITQIETAAVSKVEKTPFAREYRRELEKQHHINKNPILR